MKIKLQIISAPILSVNIFLSFCVINKISNKKALLNLQKNGNAHNKYPYNVAKAEGYIGLSLLVYIKEMELVVYMHLTGVPPVRNRRFLHGAVPRFCKLLCARVTTSIWPLFHSKQSVRGLWYRCPFPKTGQRFFF